MEVEREKFIKKVAQDVIDLLIENKSDISDLVWVSGMLFACAQLECKFMGIPTFSLEDFKKFVEDFEKKGFESINLKLGEN